MVKPVLETFLLIYSSSKQICNCKIFYLEYDIKTNVVPTDGKKGLCLVCNKTFSRLDSAKRHFQNNHVVKPPMTCPLCYQEFATKPKCEEHLNKDHKIASLDELKNSTFIPLTEDGLSGLTLLENKKVICTVCTESFATRSSGKRHFLKKHAEFQYQQEVNNNDFKNESQFPSMFNDEDIEA